MWNDESHDKGNHPWKTDDASVSQQEKDQVVRLVLEICKALGTSQGTVIRIPDQSRYGTESLRRSVAQAEVDAGDVSDWECQLALQDAFSTRLKENWYKLLSARSLATTGVLGVSPGQGVVVERSSNP